MKGRWEQCYCECPSIHYHIIIPNNSIGSDEVSASSGAVYDRIDAEMWIEIGEVEKRLQNGDELRAEFQTLQFSPEPIERHCQFDQLESINVAVSASIHTCLPISRIPNTASLG